MVKLTVPLMVQDPAFRPMPGIDLYQDVNLDDEFFLDGPISKRVAVLDFDENTGALRSGVKYIPPPPGRKKGEYVVANRNDPTDRDLLAVSVFATVWKTMQLFEGKDALGRRLTWAFDGPQLLVVPRAGRMANAYYERASRSVQFFYFASAATACKTVYSCASRDIVAHETAHAILDGILPDLYSALTPQAIALHECIADLTALLSAFDMSNLVAAVLAKTGGRIDVPSEFSAIAEEFGRERGGSGPLRSLNNNRSLDPKAGLDYVRGDEPHDLSEVLSGALFRTMCAVYEQWLKKFKGSPEKALGIASRQFRRMIFRALDYAPPGEISFVDYGAAIIAADEAHHPDEASGRKALIVEFVKRRIVPDKSALNVRTNFRDKALDDIDVATICESDWAAYEFANQNRKLLGIPDKVPFRVLPRRDSTKLHYHRGNTSAEAREMIFKVSWNVKEPQNLGGGFPTQRQITVGTTLVVDWDTRMVRSLLTGDYAAERKNRDAMLKRLVAENHIRIGDEPPIRSHLSPSISAESSGNLMRVRGTARMLHIAR
ncbi:MAG TPA: hypothetical protein VJZ00_17095 [Thermoanaerobaculia bacterium]|nr:hypothetical protein [Thermoanaerobaculia bacterium]